MAKRKFFNFGNLTVVEKTSDKTVCRTPNGKEVSFDTPHGKFNRYGRELKKGSKEFTGEALSDSAFGYRMGYRAALAEQSRIYRKKNGMPAKPRAEKKSNSFADIVLLPAPYDYDNK